MHRELGKETPGIEGKTHKELRECRVWFLWQLECVYKAEWRLRNKENGLWRKQQHRGESGSREVQ